MPWEMVRNSDGSYRVQKQGDPSDVKMKHGTKRDARAQLRLLRASEYGWKPTGLRRRQKDDG